MVGGDKEPTQQRAAASSQPQQRFTAGQQVSSRAHLMDKGSAHSVFWSMHVKHAKPFRPPAAAGSSLLLPEQGQADLLEPLLKTESKHRCSQRPAREHSSAELRDRVPAVPTAPLRGGRSVPSQNRCGGKGSPTPRSSSRTRHARGGARAAQAAARGPAANSAETRRARRARIPASLSVAPLSRVSRGGLAGTRAHVSCREPLRKRRRLVRARASARAAPRTKRCARCARSSLPARGAGARPPGAGVATATAAGGADPRRHSDGPGCRNRTCACAAAPVPLTPPAAGGRAAAPRGSARR